MGTEESCGREELHRAQEAGRKAQLTAWKGLRSTRATARQRVVGEGGRECAMAPESLLKTHLTPGDAIESRAPSKAV